MSYLAFVKQIGWDKLAGVVVRVVAAVVEAIVKLVRRPGPRPVAPPEEIRVTVLSISTETISISGPAQWTAGANTAPISASPSATMLQEVAPAHAPVQPTIAESPPPSAWTSNETPAGTNALHVRAQSK